MAENPSSFKDPLSTPRTILPIRASELPPPHAAPCCRRCTNENGYLARYIKINKAEALRWVCDNCEDYKTAGDLPRTILGDMRLETLPLRVDRSQEASDWPECEVCGQSAASFHHWAPRSIFPDWPWTLGNYLCQAHHDEWHERMHAHGLRWPHELKETAQLKDVS